MKKNILMVLVTFVAFSQIGCGDDKKEKQIKAMAAACYSTPECVMKLNNPALAKQLAVASAEAKANGGTGKVIPDGKGGTIPVLPQSIQQQVIKVQAALEADANNPRSPHYDPARAPASTTQVALTSGGAIAPASVSGPPPGNVASGGGGETLR